MMPVCPDCGVAAATWHLLDCPGAADKSAIWTPPPSPLADLRAEATASYGWRKATKKSKPQWLPDPAVVERLVAAEQAVRSPW